jgi:MFS family permease
LVRRTPSSRPPLPVFSQLGLDPNTTSLLATGVYGITNTVSFAYVLGPPLPKLTSLFDGTQVFTIPAVLFLDSVGRRPLLMAGAAGCGISLVVVGSLIAAYGHDWPSHVVAGRVAIGECHRNDLCPLDTLTRSALQPLCISTTSTFPIRGHRSDGSSPARSSTSPRGPRPSRSLPRRRGCVICKSPPGRAKALFIC